MGNDMVNDVLELRCRTSIEEKIKRFEHINGVFMGKYFDLVWFARSDEKKLLEEERYETLNRLKEIAEKYKEEVEELCGETSDWNHGFNSGILAYSRFLLHSFSEYRILLFKRLKISARRLSSWEEIAQFSGF